MVYLSVQSQFRFLSKSDRPCTDDEDHEDESSICREMCDVEFYVEHCRCWPLSWILDNHTLSGRLGQTNVSAICGQAPIEIAKVYGEKIPHFSDERCANALRSRLENPLLNSCYAMCTPSCLKTVYQMVIHQMPPQYATHKFDPDDAAVCFGFSDFDFIYLEEQYRLEWTNVMSNIGGVFGLWLGCCIVTLLYAPVYLLKQIASKLKNGRKGSHNISILSSQF